MTAMHQSTRSYTDHRNAAYSGDLVHLSLGNLQRVLCPNLDRARRDDEIRLGRCAVAHLLASEFPSREGAAYPR